MVGIVLGGGIENGQPRPLLKDRLDTAASLLAAGKVRKLIVSGDNRFENYNEPLVMQNYLIQEKGVDPDKIQLDNAGRSTYETCERAQKIFSLDRALFISETTHLPRVLYTCRSFGVEAYGYSSDGQSSAGLKVGQRWREILARTKAGINLYFVGERTILGEKIDI
jgi:vancomycin permeability regulator SanA